VRLGVRSAAGGVGMEVRSCECGGSGGELAVLELNSRGLPVHQIITHTIDRDKAND
jgi:hypothetical protein